MDFLNIGTGELIFLVLLGILLIGPRKTVELMQQGGRFFSRIQREWRAVQRDVMAEVHSLKNETLEQIKPSQGQDEIKETISMVRNMLKEPKDKKE